MSFRRLTLVIAGGAVAILLFTGTACAQTIETRKPSGGWVVADALGYGSLGFVAGAVTGIAATIGSDCGFGPCEGAVMMALGSGLLGAAGGAALALNARKAAMEGRPMTRRHRALMEVGGVVGGATLGALISSTMINGEGSGTPIGSDELTFFSLTGSGLLMGMWFVTSHRRELDRLTVSPSVTGARYGVSASMSF